MTAAIPPTFFVAGGTLPPGTPSYIPRRADEELLQGLLAGEFCYVLTSRQMGKSSLMVRTAARLREDGVRVAMLDLTAIGRNLTADRWYYALLLELGDSLGMEDVVEATWNEVAAQAPLHGFLRALRKLVHAAGDSPVVVFVDEVDYVRSLSFSVDEFFAAIRACYNERAADDTWNRLTFCLMGVAAPSDLIRDPRVTPFNIGRPIRLDDFSDVEAFPLVLRLGGGDQERAKAMLHRITGWTGGHPYLTQKLLQDLSGSGHAPDLSQVDEACWRLFLRPREREIDSNLLFVRETILHSQADLTACMEMYARVLDGHRIGDAESDRIAAILRLSGVVRVADGCLRPRNAIYERVFDRKWIVEQMPGTELRRQRAAYRRGALRVAGLSAAILSIMAALMLWNVRVTRLAGRSAETASVAASRARSESARANGSAAEARKLLYFADMLQAPQAWESGNIRRLNELLTETRLNENRGFEWDYWDRLGHLDIPFQPSGSGAALRGVSPTDPSGTRANTPAVIAADGSSVAIQSAGKLAVYDSRFRNAPVVLNLMGGETPIALSSGGRWIATMNAGTHRMSVWSGTTGVRRSVTTMRGVFSARFSPDGLRLAARATGQHMAVFDIHTGRQILRLGADAGMAGSSVEGYCFSPDGNQIATSSSDGVIRIWSGPVIMRTIRGAVQGGSAIAYSPDGRLIASSGEDQTLILWRASDGRLLRETRAHEGLASLSFSPDGRRLATGGTGGIVRVWDVESLHELFQLRGHQRALQQVAFTTDGSHLLSRDYSGAVKLWLGDGDHAVLAIPAHRGYALSAIFSPDGTRLVTIGGDLVSRAWDAATGRPLLTLGGHRADLYAAAVSPDGRWIATGAEDSTARIWDASTGRPVRVLHSHFGRVNTVCFSPDSGLLLTAGEDHTAILWDVSSGKSRMTCRYPERIWCAAFAPDGSRFAIGGMAGSIEVRRVAGGHLTCSATVAGVLKSVAFSPDGNWIAVGTGNHAAGLWDSHTGRLVRQFLGHENVVNDVCFSPDGRRLLTASYDGTARLWDTATGREVLTLHGRGRKLATARFSSDGKRIVTASMDGTVCVWSAIRPSVTAAGAQPAR